MATNTASASMRTNIIVPKTVPAIAPATAPPARRDSMNSHSPPSTSTSSGSSAYASRENHDCNGASVSSAGPSKAQRGPTTVDASAYSTRRASAPRIAGTTNKPVSPPADQPSASSVGR